MFNTRYLASALLLLVAVSSSARAQGAGAHTMTAADKIAWSPTRNGLASAVLEGNPAALGQPYTLALKLDDGAWIQPHFHPNDKRVAVIKGTLLMGIGDSVVVDRTTALQAGSFVLVPATSHHFEGARGETILFLYGTGPLATTFVDAHGRPR